jgi:hypothetical protein
MLTNTDFKELLNLFGKHKIRYLIVGVPDGTPRKLLDVTWINSLGWRYLKILDN